MPVPMVVTRAAGVKVDGECENERAGATTGKKAVPCVLPQASERDIDAGAHDVLNQSSPYGIQED